MLNDLGQAGYRPFFLLTGLAATAGGMIWWWPWEISQPVFLHWHLLLFGMGGAAIAGYLMTALPSWTNRTPVPPGVIWSLVGLWLLARLAGSGTGQWSVWWVLLPGTAFFALLAAFLAWRVACAGAWSRLHLALSPLLPALAEALLVSAWQKGGAGTAAVWAGLAFALLLVLIGGRAVPAFTVTGLALHGIAGRVRTSPWDQGLSLGLLAAALLVLVSGGDEAMTSGLLIAAGMLQFVRLAGWQPGQAWRIPALLMLQLAWAWLSIGLVLLGVALGWPNTLWPGTALHGLTMGAMGGMIMAIAMRSAMRRTPKGLQPTSAQLAAAVLVLIAPLLRLLPGPFGPSEGIRLAALCWSTGWLLFLWTLRPALRGPLPHPVLSGPRLRKEHRPAGGDAAGRYP